MAREYVTEDEREFFFSGRKLPTLYIAYLDFCRKVKKLDAGSIQNRKVHILRFILKFPVQCRPSRVNGLLPATIQEYTIEVASQSTKHQKRSLLIALRDFFRFLHFEGHTKNDLSVCVPTIITHRMSSIPKGMPWSVVENLLKVPNRKTFVGKRDYAIILMFARYGIRSQQLRDLKICDIDWKKAVIKFSACKGGKEVVAPLFEDVAKAVVAYFKGGRRNAPVKYEQVFLTSGINGSANYGQRPLEDSTWNIVSRALKKVEAVQGPMKHKRGPHAIRHGYASKLLAENEPIKNIADLLGHKSLETTFIYTKSSVEHLRELTRQWPTHKKVG